MARQDGSTAEAMVVRHRRTCGGCLKNAADVRAVAERGKHRICNECVRDCCQVLLDQLPAHELPELPDDLDQALGPLEASPPMSVAELLRGFEPRNKMSHVSPEAVSRVKARLAESKSPECRCTFCDTLESNCTLLQGWREPICERCVGEAARLLASYWLATRDR